MKCPLLFNFKEVEPNILGFDGLECLKEECAWWSKDHEQCDPTGLLPYVVKLSQEKEVEK